MATPSNTAYIKKLVKIVYEKERQIQSMKKTLKQRNDHFNAQNLQPELHPVIKKELQFASGQLKEVSLQMVSMEEKMYQLEAVLQDEIAKNQKLTQQLQDMERKYDQNQEIAEIQASELLKSQEKIIELTQQRDFYQNLQLNLAETNKQLADKLSCLRSLEDKQKFNSIRFQTEINELKVENRKKSNEVKTKTAEVSFKTEQIKLLQTKLILREDQVSRINGQNEKLKENFVKLTTQYNGLKTEQENLQNALSIKESQYNLINETLKDYEEFAFEISQYIESAHVKHCCSGMLKSSKKLIREAENCTTRFDAAFCKMSQLQQWMDNTAEKLEKIIIEHELPNETLENLSNIANSFQEKLELCDLTERIQKEKLEMDKNQQKLLQNLQKEVEKSEMRERSKLVELDEVREILKVTKEINRELMDEINGKQYVLSQCRKFYDQIIGAKSNPEYKTLKTLLNLKH